MMPIKTYKKIETIVLYFVIKKSLEISFQNGPERETTSWYKYSFAIRISKNNEEATCEFQFAYSFNFFCL